VETIGKLQHCNADQITGSYLSLAKSAVWLIINHHKDEAESQSEHN